MKAVTIDLVEYDGFFYDIKEGTIYYDMIDKYEHMFGSGIITRILLEVDIHYGSSKNNDLIEEFISMKRHMLISKVTSYDSLGLTTHDQDVILEFTNGHRIMIECGGIMRILSVY